ncbi:2Fe-2S iron-sulfur cluster-binding protein [Neobacillus jeddahensis]|uniref:2Fe-2S iron-sulfur cluster-binding protein n=1 Tax=Neobacillus jeddahensis TaxID=1461580 RepID=UPI000694FBA4|nr:2Fe-2S iron-sulfur cluster-binding protein [Neobacillus jeddahensis]
MLKIKIDRFEENRHSQADYFEIPNQNDMTVLAVLELIYRERDPTIAYRFSCKTGLCGTCAMMINHKSGLSCMKAAAAYSDGYLHLSPLAQGITVRDLVKEVR